MKPTAWVFPGQGSQESGMEADLGEVPAAQDRFKTAERVLGWSVPAVCGGDRQQLSQTRYTQPCLYTIECVLVDRLCERVPSPALVAGHSLGEYVALYAAGALDFETGLRLVAQRAALMDAAQGGKMVALMKFEREQLEAQLAATPDAVLANDNSPAQAVISGKPEAVDAVVERVGAKRAIPLEVSGAFHSPLMAEAARSFAQVLDAVTLADARMPVLPNADPRPITDGTTLKACLRQQMTAPVRWRETVLQLRDSGIERVIEVGPGKVLQGLIGKTCAPITATGASSAVQIDALAAAA